MSPVLRLAVLVAVLPAAAYADVEGASPRSMMLEVKLSPYRPNLDPLFSAAYPLFYGSGPMLLGELEFDYQFFQKFGSLAVAASAGYAEKYGHALSTTGASQSSGFHVAPVKLLLVYRFDWLFQKLNVPFVPYLKGGPLLMPWWITKGADIEVAPSGQRGAGYKLGLEGVAGLAFALDFLDKRLARDFDTSMGVNHTYLFAEFTYQNTDLVEFSPNTTPLNLSSTHWMFGLGLEF
jgi:hypothetical protein